MQRSSEVGETIDGSREGRPERVVEDPTVSHDSRRSRVILDSSSLSSFFLLLGIPTFPTLLVRFDRETETRRATGGGPNPFNLSLVSFP